MLREHLFFVTVCKHLFHHPERGLIITYDPIKVNEAKSYQLSPILLYGLTVLGLPISWLTYCQASSPRSLKEVLFEGWTEAPDLRGLPDNLIVNVSLAASSKHLARDLAKIGVKVVFTKTENSPLTISQSLAQKESLLNVYKSSDQEDHSFSGSLKTIYQQIRQYHEQFLTNKQITEAQQKKIMAWLALDYRQPIPMETDAELDWHPGQFTLRWEKTVKSSPPRYFDFDELTGLTYLRIRPADDRLPYAAESVQSYNPNDNGPKITKILLSCWPCPLNDIAEALGISEAVLLDYTANAITLEPLIRSKLETILNIEERNGQRFAIGPYVLRPQNIQELVDAYMELTAGGQAAACELYPMSGKADPNFRFAIINPFDKLASVLMVPRSLKGADRLKNILVNFDGIRLVTKKFHDDVISTCSRACASFLNNVKVMRKFALRYEEDWKDAPWLPGQSAEFISY
ncbi:MAG: hypothetical protein LBV23_04085 [Deltaproteobacteria bacterium]|jgi:hypothetical protein|nr:hypothetical protein [Deltaproteobacteria bacterium]